MMCSARKERLAICELLHENLKEVGVVCVVQPIEWAVMRREIVFGFTLGIALASIGVLRMVVGATFGSEFGAEWATISVVVGLSLVAVVVWGVTIGSMLPFVLRRLGADPATSSTPFVATIVDVTGLILYFGIAAAFMK